MHQTDLRPREERGQGLSYTILDVERGNERGHGGMRTRGKDKHELGTLHRLTGMKPRAIQVDDATCRFPVGSTTVRRERQGLGDLLHT